MSTNNREAFTLVELLVVISIIIVLLAILVPATGKALYNAKLAACGAHQKGIGTGMNTYAYNNKRNYPKRTALEQYTASVEGVGSLAGAVSTYGALRLSLFGGNTTVGGSGASQRTGNDDRHLYAEYMSINLFEDPLCERPPITDPQTYNQGESVFASIDMWWDIGFEGFGYMRKTNSRITWRNPDTRLLQSIAILAADRSVFRSNGNDGFVHSSHPDRDTRIQNDVRRGSYAILTNEWASTWQNDVTWELTKYDKTVFDRNYLLTDASVHQVRDMLSLTDRSNGVRPVDDRLEAWPWINHDDDVGDGSYLYREEFQLLPKVY